MTTYRKRLVGREEQDFLDVGGVRQEHDQSVNAKTPSTSRRQTVLEAAVTTSANCYPVHIRCAP